MILHWSVRAKQHLQEIRQYIAASSPRYADRVVQRIIRKSERLKVFPDSGAVVEEFPEQELREMYVYKYRVIYRIRLETVEIIAVIHAARRLPPNLAN